MQLFRYMTSGVCSREIQFAIEDGVVTHVEFIGGCPGNTHGVAALAVGRRADELIGILEGVKCGPKPTSCPAQFAEGLKAALEMIENGELEKSAS